MVYGMVGKDRSLTAKQLAAVDYYLSNGLTKGNKTKSYRAAYSCGKMKDKTVHRKACELFDLPHVKVLINTAMAKAVDVVGINAAWVLKRAALLADFNINKFIEFQDGVAVYDFTTATDDDWYCISEYTFKSIGKADGGKHLASEVKIKSHCKLKALEIVGRHVEVQAFRDQVGLGNPDGTSMETPNPHDYIKARAQALNDDDC